MVVHARVGYCNISVCLTFGQFFFNFQFFFFSVVKFQSSFFLNRPVNFMEAVGLLYIWLVGVDGNER